jgi:hypothetical protein
MLMPQKSEHRGNLLPNTEKEVSTPIILLMGFLPKEISEKIQLQNSSLGSTCKDVALGTKIHTA